MRGVGTATGAITFVNALFTGVGSAAAVALPVRAEVEVAARTSGAAGTVALDPACDTPLARASLLDACRRFGGGAELDLRLSITSTIPAAKGLKSSSAIGVAIGRAVAAALGRPTSAVAEATASAEVSRSIGMSATGSFDDALAAAAGGVAVTDNDRRSVLVRGSPDPAWEVVLWVPEGTHAPSPQWLARFREHAAAARPAVAAAERGDWLAAMEANTELVERALGVNHRPLRLELQRRGALASGVSGLGPTIASVVPRGQVRSFVRNHPAGSTHVLTTEFVPLEPGPGVSG